MFRLSIQYVQFLPFSVITHFLLAVTTAAGLLTEAAETPTEETAAAAETAQSAANTVPITFVFTVFFFMVKSPLSFILFQFPDCDQSIANRPGQNTDTSSPEKEFLIKKPTPVLDIQLTKFYSINIKKAHYLTTVHLFIIYNNQKLKHSKLITTNTNHRD